jgi:tetratricopeptide (TPR) repeat protein
VRHPEATSDQKHGLGCATRQAGRLPEAIAEFQRGLKLDGDNTELWSGLGHAYAFSGDRAEAHKVLDHLQKSSASTYVSPYAIAIIYAGLGEKDQAFAALEQAFTDRSYFLAIYLPTDARLDKLRSDSRFSDLLQRIRLPK